MSVFAIRKALRYFDPGRRTPIFGLDVPSHIVLPGARQMKDPLDRGPVNQRAQIFQQDRRRSRVYFSGLAGGGVSTSWSSFLKSSRAVPPNDLRRVSRKKSYPFPLSGANLRGNLALTLAEFPARDGTPRVPAAPSEEPLQPLVWWRDRPDSASRPRSAAGTSIRVVDLEVSCALVAGRSAVFPGRASGRSERHVPARCP
jgi:hypothetical protein